MNLFFKRNFGSGFFLLVKNPKPSIGRIACMIVNSYKNGQNIKNILEGTGEKSKGRNWKELDHCMKTTYIYGFSSEGPPQSTWKLEHKQKAIVIELENELGLPE